MTIRTVFAITIIFIVFHLTGTLAAQDIPTTPKILRLENVEVPETDTAINKLRKKSFNATRNELHARINLWSQEIFSIDGVIDSMERIHKLRIDIETMPDEFQLAVDKAEAAEYLLEQRKSSKTRRGVVKETELVILESYKLRCKLEAETIKLGQK